MADHLEQTQPDASPAAPRSARGLLARLRIRKKLIVLHTTFSFVLAAILLFALRPAIGEVVARAEMTEARLLVELELSDPGRAARAIKEETSRAERMIVDRGTAESLGLSADAVKRATATPGVPVSGVRTGGQPCAVALDPRASIDTRPQFCIAQVRMPEARAAVWRLYALLVIALLAVYALVAIALEALVLPRHVYAPIRRILAADEALQHGRSGEELIPPDLMPADELGEIMRSRNGSIIKMRAQEKALEDALDKLERSAADLVRKNHMLERARQNLADADRLVSLGMMSAGLAHEMNTPLAVLKGMAERIARRPEAGLSSDEASLMLRVVGRLEKLSESLLDFARVRPPAARPIELRSLVEEAVTLVRIDREAADVALENLVPPGLVAFCDGDRMVQVFVNLVRNGVDAARETPAPHRVTVRAERIQKHGEEWISLTIADSGPGIAPEVLSRLFEPFVSTRLDARGTGLGLAVAEGIVREHGGVMLARNQPGGGGAVFEVLLPLSREADPPAPDSSVVNADAR